MKNKIVISIIFLLTILCISLIIIFPIDTDNKMTNNEINDVSNEKQDIPDEEIDLDIEDEEDIDILEDINVEETQIDITTTNSNDNDVTNNNQNSNSYISDETNTDNNEVIIENKTIIQEYKQDLARQVLELVNQTRSENGLQPLTWNTSLEQSAMIRSKELVSLFSHTRPNGESCFTVVDTYYYAIGENIAAGQPSAEAVFNAWMNSDGHRTNILSENFTDVGISLYYDEKSTYKYNWVQVFIGK